MHVIAQQIPTNPSLSLSLSLSVFCAKYFWQYQSRQSSRNEVESVVDKIFHGKKQHVGRNVYCYLIFNPFRLEATIRVSLPPLKVETLPSSLKRADGLYQRARLKKATDSPVEKSGRFSWKYEMEVVETCNFLRRNGKPKLYWRGIKSFETFLACQRFVKQFLRI